MQVAVIFLLRHDTDGVVLCPGVLVRQDRVQGKLLPVAGRHVLDCRLVQFLVGAVSDLVPGPLRVFAIALPDGPSGDLLSFGGQLVRPLPEILGCGRPGVIGLRGAAVSDVVGHPDRRPLLVIVREFLEVGGFFCFHAPAILRRPDIGIGIRIIRVFLSFQHGRVFFLPVGVQAPAFQVLQFDVRQVCLLQDIGTGGF